MTPAERLAKLYAERKIGKVEFARAERLIRVLADRDVGKSELARRIEESSGSRCRYYNVHRWTLGREFNKRNRERAARALGLAPDYFDAPDAAEARERETAQVFERWRATSKVAKILSRAQLDVLASIRFTDAEVRPSPAYYNAFAAAMIGLIREDEIDDVAAENDELARTIAQKTPPKRR